MADRVSASIQIGGTLSAGDYAELAEIIAGEDLSIEWDGERFKPDHREIGEPLSLFAHEVAWGRFARLEPWCLRMGLPFARWCEGYPTEWGAQRVVFTGEGEPTSYDSDTANRILMERPTAEKLGSMEAILAWFDAADFSVPPLLVEGDPVGGAPTMTSDPPFRKVFDTVATREQMFELLNEIPDCSFEDRVSGRACVNRWFEIERESYESMLEILPPLFMRAGMFAISELKAGNVGSVFFDISIAGHSRWFHGYCNLADHVSPDAMRAAIIEHETTAVANMTREQKLDLIWSRTHDDFRGIADEANPDAWPAEHHGKRSILVYETGVGTVCKLLEDLTDDEIADRLQRHPTI